MFPHSFGGRHAADAGVAFVEVVPGFDPANGGEARVVLGMGDKSVHELALQGGEEALTKRIVSAITGRAQRRTDAELQAALAQGKRIILAALVRVVDDICGPSLLPVTQPVSRYANRVVCDGTYDISPPMPAR